MSLWSCWFPLFAPLPRQEQQLDFPKLCWIYMATNLARLKYLAAAKCNQASTPTAQTLFLSPPFPTILTRFQSSFLDCCQVPTPAHVISVVPLMQVLNCASSSTLPRAHSFITRPRRSLGTTQRCSLVGSVWCSGKGSGEQGAVYSEGLLLLYL